MMTRLLVALFALLVSVSPALSQRQVTFEQLIEAYADPTAFAKKMEELHGSPEAAMAAMFSGSVTLACVKSPAAREGFTCPGHGYGEPQWKVNHDFFFDAMNRSLLGTEGADATPGSACLSCHFLAEVAGAMFLFTSAAFLFFWSAFVSLSPALISCWLVVKAIGLFATGGQDGEAFARGLSLKLVLFGFLWLVMAAPGATPGSSWAFETSGPGFVSYAFEVGDDLRAHTMRAVAGDSAVAPVDGGAGEFGPLGCDIPGQMPHLLERPHAGAVVKVVDFGCSVERFHAIGFGLAGWMTLDGFVTFSRAFGATWEGVSTRRGHLGTGAFKALMGLFLFVVFATSAIWLIFQILDVVVKITITAMLLPLLALAGLFEKTRGMAKRGGESFLAAFVQCVSLSLVLGLFFHLFTYTPAVYEITREVYSDTFDLDEPLQPLVTTSTVAQFSEMMFRANIDPESWFADTSAHIPFHVSTPWFIYLLFCSLSLLSLGRKLLTIAADFFQVLGHAGTALADAGLGLLKGGQENAAGGVAVVGVGAAAVSRVRQNPFGGARSGASMNPMKKGKNK